MRLVIRLAWGLGAILVGLTQLLPLTLAQRIEAVGLALAAALYFTWLFHWFLPKTQASYWRPFVPVTGFCLLIFFVVGFYVQLGMKEARYLWLLGTVSLAIVTGIIPGLYAATLSVVGDLLISGLLTQTTSIDWLDRAVFGLSMFASAGLAATLAHAVRAHARETADDTNRLLAEAERRAAQWDAHARRQAALFRLSADLAEALDEDEICRRVVKGLHDTLGYAYLGLFLVDEATGDRVLHASDGWRDAPVNWRIPPGQGLSERPLLDGQLQYTPDVRRDPRYVPGLSSGAEVDLPLRLSDEVVGVLVVESSRPQAFGQEDFDVLTAAANQASLALGKAWLVDETVDRAAKLAAYARRQAALVKLSAELSAAADEQDVCERAVNTLADVVGYENIALYLRRETSTERLLHAVRGISQKPGFVIPPGQGLTELPLLDGQLHYTPDVTASPRFVRGAPGTRSEVDIPLKLGDEVIGVIGAESPAPDGFNEDDFAALTAAANQTALAIGKARLLADERQRVDELDALRATLADISSELDLSKLLGSVLQRAVAMLNAAGGNLGIWDEARQAIVIAVSHNLGQDFAGTQLALGEGAMGRVAQTCQPLIVPDYANWEGRSAQYDQIPLHSVIASPLMARGQLVGAIGVVHSDPAAQFGPSDLHLLNLFAQQAAIAVTNARLYEDAHRRAAQLMALNEIAAIVSSTIEIDQVLEQIGEAVQRALTADTYLVITVDDLTGRRTLEVLYDEGQRFPKQELPPGKGASGWVIHNRRPLLLHDLEAEAPRLGIEIAMAGKGKHSASWLGVPMETGGHLVGVLAVGSYRASAFGEEDIEILQNIAQQAALAVEHGRHHAEVEEQARRDSLTQVFNHGYFLKQLQVEVAQALEQEYPLALIMLDVDFFKQYNDTYGHVVGDQVLRLTVQAIHAHVKHTDLVGRWGGEEFAIALPHADGAQARAVAERIRSTLASLPLHDRDGRPIPLPTVSQGLAVLPDETENIDVLIQLADGRLYQAKERGRDQIE